jgi:hypothetical protein
MEEHHGPASMRGVLRGVRANKQTLDDVVQAAREHAPHVAALPLEEVSRRIGSLLDSLIDDYLEGPGFEGTFKAAAELAEDRARQGVPLRGLLDGVQAGRLQWVSGLVAASRAAGTGVSIDELLGTLIELDGASHQMLAQLVQSYRDTELELARTAWEVRAQAVRDLLHGDLPLERIAEVGLSARRRYHCVIAHQTDPRTVRDLAPRLAGGEGAGGLVDGYLCVLTARRPGEEDSNGALMVVSPPATPDHAPRLYRMCRTAFDAARSRGLLGLQELHRLAVPAVVNSQPDFPALLADELLRALIRTDRFHRQLAETGLAYLERGGRIDLTARALHVHPNTVKHRLRRLAELTGFEETGDGEDVLDYAVRWSWALRAWLAPGPSGPPHMP